MRLKDKYVKLQSVGRGDIIKFSLLIVLFIIMIVAAILLTPFFLSLKEQSVRDMFLSKIRGMGAAGVALAVVLSAAQVVLAIIPGEPVEIVMGILYGTWGGLFVCLGGILLGTLIILTLVRFLGSGFVHKIFKKESLEKFEFLNNSAYLDSTVFVLFLIPGTPKDILTYFVPLTPMKPLRFIIISVIARLPSVITSTIVGAGIDENKWGQSIIIFVVTAIIGLLGIWINSKFIASKKKL